MRRKNTNFGGLIPAHCAMHNLDELITVLAMPQRIVILPHLKPDADALGSALALDRLFRKLGHESVVISPTDYPAFLDWMPDSERVVVFGEDTRRAVRSLIEEATLLFCVDFGELKRLEEISPMIANSEAQIVLIDHHLGKADFAHFELWDTTAAATCELVYDFIGLMGHEALLDVEMASCIYAGIMTDTGQFKFPSTTAKVHRIAAALHDIGLDTARIHRLIYDNNSIGRLKMLGYFLNDKLVVLEPLKTAYFAVAEQELARFNPQTGDTEGFVNYALSAQGINLAALFNEKNGVVKVSFRSVGSFNVAEFAARHFNGGGHRNAAGGRLDGYTAAQAATYFESLLAQYQTAIVNSQ